MYALGIKKIGLYKQAAVREFYKVYRFDRSRATAITARSLENDFQCHTNLGPFDEVGDPLHLLIDLTSRFTSPFQLR